MTDNTVGIKVTTVLDKTASDANINKSLKDIQIKVNGKPIKLKMDASSIKKEYKTLTDGSFALAKSTFSATDALGKQHDMTYKLDEETKKFALSNEKVSSSMGEISKKTKDASSSIDSLSKSTEKSAQSFSNVLLKIAKWGVKATPRVEKLAC